MTSSIIPSTDLTVRQYISGMEHCLQDCRICPRYQDGCEFLATLRKLQEAAQTCVMTAEITKGRA